MTNKFMDYFTSCVDFPGDTIISNPLPLDEFQSYVSSTYLSGFINYIKIKKAHRLTRYSITRELINKEDLPEYRDLSFPGYSNWIKPNRDMLADEVFDLYTKMNVLAHPNLSVFNDDVLVLGQARDNPNIWIFFWFDCDVSDCCIGRFETDDSEEEVLRKYTEYLSEHSYVPTREIPLHFFNGWISF